MSIRHAYVQRKNVTQEHKFLNLPYETSIGRNAYTSLYIIFARFDRDYRGLSPI